MNGINEAAIQYSLGRKSQKDDQAQGLEGF